MKTYVLLALVLVMMSPLVYTAKLARWWIEKYPDTQVGDLTYLKGLSLCLAPIVIGLIAFLVVIIRY